MTNNQITGILVALFMLIFFMITAWAANEANKHECFIDRDKQGNVTSIQGGGCDEYDFNH